MGKLKPERRFPFGGVEVFYEDDDGAPQLKVLAPPDVCLELYYPTADEVAPIQEEFGDFVRELMKKEEDPEFLDAYKNYQEVQDFYFNEVLPKVRDLLFRNYPEAEDREIIDRDMQYTQIAKLNQVIDRVFGMHAVLKALHETEGTVSGN